MNKKILSMALVSCFAVMSLASCGGKGFELSLPEVNVLSYDEIKDKEINITFWHSFGKTPEEALNRQVAKFMEVYPNIKVEAVSKGGYDNLKKAVSMELTTGNTPDVVLGYPDHFAEYLAGGIMVPLDDYMNSDDPEIGIGKGAKNAKGDFFDNYMTENRQYYNNLTFGLPFNKSTELAFYNKTVFDEFDIKVPETWQEMPAIAKQLKEKVAPYYGKVYKNEKTGVELDFTKVTKAEELRPMTYDSKANAFITLTRDFGGTYTEVGESFEEGFIGFDNDGTKEALKLLKDMSDEYLFGIPDHWEEKYCSKMFTQLQSFYTIGSSAGSYHNNPAGDKFEVGAAPIPYYSKDGVTNKSVIQQGTNIAMLSNNTDEERMAAWLLIRFLTAYQNEETGYDANAEFAIEASYLPVRESGVNSKVYQEFLNADLEGASGKDKIVVAAASQATKYGKDWDKFTDPAFIGSSTVRAVADTIIPQVIVAGVSPEQAIKNAYDQLPSYIK